MDNNVICRNCGKEFRADELVYEGVEEMDFCPYCGEGDSIMTACERAGHDLLEAIEDLLSGRWEVVDGDDHTLCIMDKETGLHFDIVVKEAED